MSTEAIKLIRDVEKGVWRWGGDGGGLDYMPITTRMTLALRRAAMRAILMLH